MEMSSLLLLLQEALPPPPAPTASPDIDTARVVGIVVVSLGVVFLLALAAKPLVVRKDRPMPVEPESSEPQESADGEAVQPVEHAAIIPFPSPDARDPADGGEDAALSARLQWVTGTSGRRRKLGDRGVPAGPAPASRQPTGGVLIPFQAASQPTSGASWADTERFMRPPLPDPEEAPGTDALADADTPHEQRAGEELAPMADDRNGHHATAGYASLAPHSRGEPTRPADSILGSDLLETLQAQPMIQPREPATDAAIDDATLAGITQTVRELLFCANVGELLHGFALYSDPFLFRFMDSTGLSEEEFQATYGSVPPKDPEHWTRLAGLSEIERLPDGRIEATATYRDVTGAPANGAERYRFVLSPDGTFWMIDDIRAVEHPAG
jgi:hypothetical protein